MVKLNINMPMSCQNCKFKGARLCYIAVWLEMEYREVPKKDRPEWCPMEEVEDDRNTNRDAEVVCGMPIPAWLSQHDRKSV